MTTFTVSIMLQFPAMPKPRRVEVSPRQLYILDQHAERRLDSDGTPIYVQSGSIPAEAWLLQ